MKQEEALRVAFWILLGTAAGLLYATARLIKNGYQPYAGVAVIGIVILGYIAIRLRRKQVHLQEIREVRTEFGKIKVRKRNFKKIKWIFSFRIQQEGKKFFIDDQTWNDLNMDRVFEKVDRTLSTPGEQYLYYLMRNPVFEEEVLKERGEKIRFFETQKEIREKVQIALSHLGRLNKHDISELLWGTIKYNKKMRFLLNFMAAMAVASIMSFAILGFGQGFAIAMIISLINGLIHQQVKKNIGAQSSSIAYLAKLIKAAKEAGGIKEKEFILYREQLEKQAKATESIYKKASLMYIGRLEGVDMFFEYFNIFVLNEARAFYNAIEQIEAQIETLREMYLTLGEMDALISIASYRAGMPFYVEPIFKRGSKELKAVGVNHPLIEQGVSNSIHMLQGVIITGSNMSGKSTFLRTIGINALFAQTIYTCLAKEYEGDYFKVMSSMNVVDNVEGGKSFYLGEAEALYRIIETCGEGIPILCLIDEIFKGTNPIERVNASAEILLYLAKHNCLVGVATHDLEITKMVGQAYDCYYFTESVGEQGLEFDYTIKEGVSSTRNAVKLLEYMGYPEEIISNTNQRILEKM